MSKNKQDILKWIIISLAGLVIIILIFGAGIFIGGIKAKFSYGWAENYHRNFAGPKTGFMSNWRKMPPMPGDFIESHGAFGEIIEMQENSFVIKGRENIEKIILIKQDTVINKKSDLAVGDQVVVIGSPNDNGQIEAKLIRVFNR
ncbi:MAG: hypothetical protein ABIG90_00195 [bacterium]